MCACVYIIHMEYIRALNTIKRNGDFFVICIFLRIQQIEFPHN